MANRPYLAAACANGSVARIKHVCLPAPKAAASLSVPMLGGRQVVDELYELLFAAGLGDVGRVLAVDDDKRHALHVIALGEFLGALQVGADAEGVVGVGEVIRLDAVLLRPLLL